VDYTTQNNSAVANQDYIPHTDTATINAGQTSTIIDVVILGDSIAESNEQFALVISIPKGASFPDGITEISSIRTIFDDD